jgi:integrase
VYGTDRGRAAHLVRHLGPTSASSLSLAEVEAYREARLSETTKRGGPPSSGTLDREIELLKRMLNYAVATKKVSANPLASVALLKKKNVRKVVLDEAAFSRLLAAAVEWLRPILLVAFDTGMRKEEILSLRWKGQADAYGLDLKAGAIALADDDTKTDEPRTIPLTSRLATALRALPRRLGSPFVFGHPETGAPRKDIKKAFARACRSAGLEGIWFHDLRRSFVTKARRAGIPESVVMRFSGHRTRAVFDRYNIVDQSDIEQAVGRLDAAAEAGGRVLDEVGGGGAEKTKAPRS